MYNLPKRPSEWKAALQKATFAINSSVTEAIGTSPHRALFGYVPAHPFAPKIPLARPKTPSIPTSIENKMLHSQDIKNMVAKKLFHRQQLTKRSKDKRRQAVNFVPGDKVWLCQKGLDLTKPKFARRAWIGPCAIVKKCSDLIYIINVPLKKSSKSHSFKEVQAHVRNLKKYYSRYNYLCMIPLCVGP